MSELQQKLTAEIDAMVKSFCALVKVAAISDGADVSSLQDKGGAGGPEVIVQRLMMSARALLEVTSQLKRTALLTDFAERNTLLHQEIQRCEEQAVAAGTEAAAVRAQAHILEQMLDES